MDQRNTQIITLFGSNLNTNQPPDIADLPVGGLDWSDMVPNTGREGSKFWKLRKDTFMEIATYQSGSKNESL